MSGQQLLLNAKETLFNLKKEERNYITPYASFASQVIGLIANGKISAKEDLLDYTKLSYHRSNFNRQWRVFGRELEKNLQSNLSNKELLLYFGFLKRLITIEGKKEFGKRNEFRSHEQRRKDYPRFNKR